MTKEEYRASIARSIDEKIEKEFPSFLDLPFALANLRAKLLLDLAADLHCLLEKVRKEEGWMVHSSPCGDPPEPLDGHDRFVPMGSHD